MCCWRFENEKPDLERWRIKVEGSENGKNEDVRLEKAEAVEWESWSREYMLESAMGLPVPAKES